MPAHDTQIACLAPAAGAGIGSRIAERLLARPDFLQKMEDAIMGALEADQTFRSGGGGGNGGGTITTVPDFKTRLQAWISLLAHMEGDPIKRVVHQHLGDNAKPNFVAALRESPELLSAVEREVDKAKFHGRNKVKPAPVLVTELPE